MYFQIINFTSSEESKFQYNKFKSSKLNDFTILFGCALTNKKASLNAIEQCERRNLRIRNANLALASHNKSPDYLY